MDTCLVAIHEIWSNLGVLNILLDEFLKQQSGVPAVGILVVEQTLHHLGSRVEDCPLPVKYMLVFVHMRVHGVREEVGWNITYFLQVSSVPVVYFTSLAEKTSFCCSHLRASSLLLPPLTAPTMCLGKFCFPILDSKLSRKF